jgi:hypothetical protein
MCDVSTLSFVITDDHVYDAKARKSYWNPSRTQSSEYSVIRDMIQKCIIPDQRITCKVEK